jgi:type I site-specific restriction-modification system R (restriction) subunit
VTWFDGAYQINQIYEKEVPAMFEPNVFSFATEGRLFRYGSIRMPIELWGPWRDDDNQDEGQLQHVQAAAEIIVVDRIDLDTQITATFNAADVPNMVGVATRKELQELLGQYVRKVLITTIHKFGEAGGRLNERSNIIVMVDEAHRTQEGDLGRRMRQALPNAFLFGLTGTPINRADHTPSGFSAPTRTTRAT